MAEYNNAAYTYEQVLAGKGYFMKDDLLRYSDGVKTMQIRLNAVGYNCGTPDGKFGSGTDTQVRKFQTAYSLTTDGKAGRDTLTKLNAVLAAQNNDDYHKYGKRITADDVDEGNTSISDIDWIARTIYAECTNILIDQNAIAIEIRNRLNNTARVGEFSKTKPATLRSIIFYPSAYEVITNKVNNLLSPDQNSAGWKNAVDRAKNLVNRENLPYVEGITTHEFHCAPNYTPPSWGRNVVQPGGSKGNKFYSY